MKKILLFISTIIIGFSSYAQYEGFENWTQNSIQTLDDYSTSANDRGVDGANATYPVNDPVTGNLSIRLETVLSSLGDTIFGYFLSGDPDVLAPGQAVTIGAVDSIIGWYKYDILPNDSAVLLCVTTFSGTPSGGGTYYVTGSQPTWKRFAYYVGAPAADSLLIAAASSDAINDLNGIPGSWIQYDDIQLKGPVGTQNILNYSFENWSTTMWDDLNGWVTANQYAVGSPTMPAVKTTDANSGSFAIELNTILGPFGDTINGIASNGYFTNNGVAGGQPYVGSPTDLEVYYKYAPAGTDTAFINFEFKQNGSTVANYGNGFMNPAGTYALWTTSMGPMTPDSVLITVWAGSNINSQLKIDDINFLFPVGITENITVEKLVSYPNPATDEIKIKFNIVNDNNVSIRLVDITGKELTNRSLGKLSSGTYRETFNTSSYTSGIYFIEFILDDEKITERFVIK
jgi:Secretion system C-terminal sorting domain